MAESFCLKVSRHTEITVSCYSTLVNRLTIAAILPVSQSNNHNPASYTRFCKDIYSAQQRVGVVRYRQDELTCSYILASLPRLISEAFSS